MTLRIKRVHTPALREQVYAMRYRAYRRENAIPESTYERFEDEYDLQPNHVLWALTENENVIGSMRNTWHCSESSEYLIPEMTCYGDEIIKSIPSNARILSSNRFVIEQEQSVMDSTDILLLLVRCSMLTADYKKIDWIVAAARKNHLPLYQYLLKLEQASDSKIYPGLSSAMYLMVGNLEKTLTAVYEKNPNLKPFGYERMFFDENYRDVWEIGLPVEL